MATTRGDNDATYDDEVEYSDNTEQSLKYFDDEVDAKPHDEYNDEDEMNPPEEYNDELVENRSVDPVEYPHELSSSVQERDVINRAMDEIIAKVNGMGDDTTEKKLVERPKRPMPKSMLNNQKKYTEHREKEERMLSMAKKKPKGRRAASTKTDVKVVKKEVNNTGKKRVLIGGKIRYVPIRETEVNREPVTVRTPESVQTPKKVESTTEDTPEPMSKTVEKSEPIRKPSKPQREGRKIPSKYAKPLEDEVKKYAVKNVKNFSDLRRVVSRENVKPDQDIDINSASIAELRKLRIEQRRRDQAETSERIANTKESAVQSILRDESLSKFAKAVKIKNLSVASRHQRSSGVQKSKPANRVPNANR